MHVEGSLHYDFGIKREFNFMNVVILWCLLFKYLQNSSQNTTYNINYALQRHVST
jgi:hypothetical protein